jgi:hypothetical protein
MDAPITAAGMWSKAFWPHGREAQSIAFFNAPGIERLYSGVTNRIAWDRWIASLSAIASGGSSRRDPGCTEAGSGLGSR